MRAASALALRSQRAAEFRHLVWLLPAAFALHVLEESQGFTAWVNRYAWTGYTQQDFVRNNALGLALTLGSTLLLARFPKNRPLLFLYYTGVLTQQALFNSLF